MVQAIIFDCFGVLASDGWIPFKKKHFGHDPDLQRQATELNRQNNAGLISTTDFVYSIAELARVPKSEVLEAVTCSVANDELFEYIATCLKPRYKIAMLSNAGSNILSDLFSPQQIALFDEVALSYQTGRVKPAYGAYTAVSGQLGVEPETCVFVDDQERHCSGAREAGMKTILYQDFEQFQRELETLLELP